MSSPWTRLRFALLAAHRPSFHQVGPLRPSSPLVLHRPSCPLAHPSYRPGARPSSLAASCPYLHTNNKQGMQVGFVREKTAGKECFRSSWPLPIIPPGAHPSSPAASCLSLHANNKKDRQAGLCGGRPQARGVQKKRSSSGHACRVCSSPDRALAFATAQPVVGALIMLKTTAEKNEHIKWCVRMLIASAQIANWQSTQHTHAEAG